MEKYDKQTVCACLPCRCTKFVPITTPRYNKHEVEKHVWMCDLKLYNAHRKRCFYAKPKVDTKPPQLDLAIKLKPLVMFNDVNRAELIDRQNKHCMMRLLKINRYGGFVDTVNSLANMQLSKWQGHREKMLQIEKENKLFYKRILSTKSVYKYRPKEWNNFIHSLKNSARFPLIIFKKKDLDKEMKAQPSISIGLNKISTHVECFMDFTVLNGVYLGRIVLELYQELAPLEVQNFLDFCRSYNERTAKNISLLRIVKDRYFESSFITYLKAGKPRKKKASLRATSKLKHTRTGTISMIRDEKQDNNLKLCLTLCPMPELDKKNFVFGKVTKGASVLTKINGYSRKIGKPLETIVISDCGEMPDCMCHKRLIQCKEL